MKMLKRTGLLLAAGVMASRGETATCPEALPDARFDQTRACAALIAEAVDEAGLYRAAYDRCHAQARYLEEELAWLQPTTVGDLNRSGQVTEQDVLIYRGCQSGPMVPAGRWCQRAADLDGDGDVDQQDFGLLQPHIEGNGPSDESMGPACRQTLRQLAEVTAQRDRFLLELTMLRECMETGTAPSVGEQAGPTDQEVKP